MTEETKCSKIKSQSSEIDDKGVSTAIGSLMDKAEESIQQGENGIGMAALALNAVVDVCGMCP